MKRLTFLFLLICGVILISSCERRLGEFDEPENPTQSAKKVSIKDACDFAS